MTAQKGDIFKYRNYEFDIVDFEGKPPFIPADFGLLANSASTACWRGFWCVYGLKDGLLVLDELYLHNSADKYPPLNGVTVAPAEYEVATVYGKEGKRLEHIPKYMGHRVYRGVDLLCKYTGSILIGSGFDRSYYRHMGFQSYWGYRILIELSFEEGKLVSETDRSKDAAEKRRELGERRIDDLITSYVDGVPMSAKINDEMREKAKAVKKSVEESLKEHDE